VTPNVGVTYSGSTTMNGDHGGFAHDDNNVIMLVAHSSFKPQTVFAGVTTMQVAPTIVKALGLDPRGPGCCQGRRYGGTARSSSPARKIRSHQIAVLYRRTFSLGSLRFFRARSPNSQQSTKGEQPWISSPPSLRFPSTKIHAPAMQALRFL